MTKPMDTGWIFLVLYSIACIITPTVCQSCPNGWKNVYRSYSGFPVCIQRLPEPVTWTEGLYRCHSLMANPVAWNETLQENEGIFQFEELEVWSSLKIRKSKLIHSGAPVSAVGLFPFSPPQGNLYINWRSDEPKLESGDCVSLDGQRTARMASCNEKKYMYCQRYLEYAIVGPEPTFCPENFIGSVHWPKCYRYITEGTIYSNASTKCQKFGARLLNIQGELFERQNFQIPFDVEILRAVNQYYYRNLNYSQMRYWYNDPNTPSLGCGVIEYIQGSSSSTFSDDCYTNLPYMCEIDGTVDTNKKMEISASVIPWTSDRIMHTFCNLSRPLTPGENIYIYVNNRPLKYVFPADKADNTALQYIGDLDSLSPRALLNGIHRCEVRGLPSRQLWATEKYCQEPVSESIEFEGKIDVAPLIPNLEIRKFNLATDPEINPPAMADTTIFDLQKELNSAVLSLNIKVIDKEHILSGSYSGTIFSIDENGKTFHFKIMLRLYSQYSVSREQDTLTAVRFFLKEFFDSSSTENGTNTRQRRDIGGYSFIPSTLEVNSKYICGGTIYVPELGSMVHFPPVQYGSRIVSSDVCITDKKPLVSAKCHGGFGISTELRDIVINPKCIFDQQDTSPVTEELKNLTTIDIDEVNVKTIVTSVKNLTTDPEILTSVDVISAVEVLVSVANVSKLDEQTVADVVDTTNNIINVDMRKLKIAQEDGSATNRLLEVLDAVSLSLDLQGKNGVQFRRENFVMEVYDLSSHISPITGIKIKEETTAPLTNSTIETLMEGTDVNTESLDAAIILPVGLLKDDLNATRVTLNIHRNWNLFSVRSDVKEYLPNSRVIAASIYVNGVPVRSLGEYRVQSLFFPRKEDNDSVCGYWDYDIHDTSGGWATDGCKLNRTESGRYICVCDHLTNFAVLVNIGGQDTLDDSLALKIISWIGLILSIAGLSLTILSFILFKHLRKGRAQQTLFNLALSLLCFLVVFTAGIEQTHDYYGCIVVAALIHYFILVAFMWMLMEGILQYLRFVKVLGTYIPNFILKTAVPAWGIPLIPVVIVLALDHEMYKGGDKACWMSLAAFYYAFLIPVAVIILANIVIFIMILKNIVKRPKGLQSNQSERKRAMMNLRAALSVLVLLGLTWIFGFFTIEEASVVFQYIFTILNVFQGFLIFILFTAREKQVRQCWKKLCCTCCKQESKDKYAKYNTSTEQNTKSKNGNHIIGSSGTYDTKSTDRDNTSNI